MMLREEKRAASIALAVQAGMLQTASSDVAKAVVRDTAGGGSIRPNPYRAFMIENHKSITGWNAYSFDCPEGTWTGRLEQKAWGKSSNLILCFADADTGEKYRLSVFHSGGYRPRDGSHDFKQDAEPGDRFELTTRKTKTGNPDLQSARKVTLPA